MKQPVERVIYDNYDLWSRYEEAARRTLVPSSHASLSKGSQRLTVNNLLHRAGKQALLLNTNYILERQAR